MRILLTVAIRPRDKTLDEHTRILSDHTRDLAIVKNDVTNNLDKRLQLEVRVTTIEKHLGLDKKIAA